MAITRAQQVRQMLKEGSKKPVKQAGVTNYLGKQEMVTAPKFWLSEPGHVKAKLAYITDEEAKILIDKNLYGSLKGKPNIGPAGLPSLQGGDAGGLGGNTGNTGGNGGDNEPNPGDRNTFNPETGRENSSGGGGEGENAGGNYRRFNKPKPKPKPTTIFNGKKYVVGSVELKNAIKDKEKKDKEEKLSKKGFSLTDKFGNIFSSLKDKNKKFQNKTNIDLANKRAFQKYRDIEQYVDMMDDYGLTAEELADKVKADETYGYDFSGLDKGLENLVSNKGTSIESIRKNLYDVNSPVYGITGLLTDKIRPDTQVTALNTLRKARDYRDLAGTGDVSRDDLDNLRNRGKTQEQIDIMDGNVRDNDPYIPPIIQAVKKDDDDDDSTTPTRNFGGLAPRFMGSSFDFTGLADGGRAGMMDGGMMQDTPEGGIMDLESGRQMYFLGKLVKKATRAVKKVAKSPIGKAALLYGLGSLGAGALGKAQAGTGSGFFSGLKGKLFGLKSLAKIPDRISGRGTMGLLGKLGITKGGGSFMPTLKGGIGLGLGIPFALDALGVGKEEDDNSAYEQYMKDMRLDIPALRARRNLAAAFDGSTYNYEAYADGGRIGYQEGGDAEPVAKKTMPLIDMDGMEKDYREDGGFVPIGRMERADDVPARLSKNEFVFTADAVRNAGEGDIDKGAEVMYNMMKNLESGGEVSEESQGLDGAREMFQTSQRLEEVL